MDDQGLLNKDPRFIAIPGYVKQYFSSFRNLITSFLKSNMANLQSNLAKNELCAELKAFANEDSSRND